MPPQSRGTAPKPPPVPPGFQSKSTPNLPTLRSLETERISAANTASNTPQSITVSPDISSPSEPASIDDFALDSTNEALSAASSDEEDSGADEDGHVPNLPTRPVLYQSSRSYTHLASSAFAPPFYNRPPTPLPPSPSLTSLLRPNFSSQNSRPTTPDPSSDEGTHGRGGDGTQTPNSAAASTLTSTFRSAKPIPRASPRVPTYEYYGFTLYLTSSLAFVVYLLWAFLPSPFLHQLGVYYFPDRWWALAIPAWTVMFIFYIYVALASYNIGYLTLPLKSVECIVDEAANVAVVDAKGHIIRNELASWEGGGKRHETGAAAKKGGRGPKSTHGEKHSRHSSAGSGVRLDWASLWCEGTDAVMDIPVGGVCEILYGGEEEVDEGGLKDD